MENEIIHKECGGEIIVVLEDDGGCGDPECCGSISYHIHIKCMKCKKEDKIY